MATTEQEMKRPSGWRARAMPALVMGVFLCVAFVVLPLGAVAIRGGESLYSRLHHWRMLRQQIQSREETGLTLADSHRYRARIERFLLPSADRLERAREHCDTWLGYRGWAYVAEPKNVSFNEAGTSAFVTLEVRISKDRERSKKRVVAKWEKQDGAWYFAGNSPQGD